MKIINCLRCSHFKYVNDDFEIGICELDSSKKKIILGVNNIIEFCPYYNPKRYHDIEFILIKKEMIK